MSGEDPDPRDYEVADIAAALIFQGRMGEDPVAVLRQMIAEWDARHPEAVS